jgi:hypothetical protein
MFLYRDHWSRFQMDARDSDQTSRHPVWTGSLALLSSRRHLNDRPWLRRRHHLSESLLTHINKGFVMGRKTGLFIVFCHSNRALITGRSRLPPLQPEVPVFDVLPLTPRTLLSFSGLTQSSLSWFLQAMKCGNICGNALAYKEILAQVITELTVTAATSTNQSDDFLGRCLDTSMAKQK